MDRQQTAYCWFRASVVSSAVALASIGVALLLAIADGPKSLIALCAVGATSCGLAGTMAALGTTCRANDLSQHPKLQGRNQIVMSLTIFTVMIIGGMSSAYGLIFLIPNRPN
jgi:hypothetical protein